MVDPVFIGVAVLTVGSAIISLESRELIYGAIALAISMMGIAGFFLLLDSPFVAVLVIFTVMLVRTQALFTTREDKGRKSAGIVLMLIFMASIGAIFIVSGLNSQTFGNPKAPAVDFTTIGQQMLTYYSPALIALALTLAGAVIGALALARREGEEIEQKND
jgi:NADH-quinone oxidoreductase subunit J